MKGLPTISEKQFQAQVVQLARLLGWLTYHTHDSRRSAAGFPDLVCVRGQRVLFCELKTRHGDLTRAQRDWILALRNAGAETYVWWPTDWADLEQVLRRDDRPEVMDG